MEHRLEIAILIIHACTKSASLSTTYIYIAALVQTDVVAFLELIIAHTGPVASRYTHSADNQCSKHTEALNAIVPRLVGICVWL